MRRLFSYFFLASNPVGRTLQKANMMLLTKEATDKDRSLKTQLLVSTSNSSDEKISCLFYVNQSYLSTVKNGDLAMYNHNFVLGQIIVVANQPEIISNYVCAPNEVKLYTCIYDVTNGEFQGVREQLAYIVLRGDAKEVSFSYGFVSAKAKVLYSVSKEMIPHTFVSTCFKKHFSEIMNERHDKEDHSTLFYYLPFITDRKESINQWRDKVNLVLVDFSIEFIETFSPKKAKFEPHLLNSTDLNERGAQVEMLYGLFKHMAQVSNQNLSRNVDYLNVKENRNSESMEWSVGSLKRRYGSSKFKLTY